MSTPKRAIALRETTLVTIGKLADRHTRSASDVAEALARLGAREGELFFLELDAVAPLQPTRGTGRRARRDAKNEASKNS